jgi:hypothetical protein
MHTNFYTGTAVAVPAVLGVLAAPTDTMGNDAIKLIIAFFFSTLSHLLTVLIREYYAKKKASKQKKVYPSATKKTGIT